MVTFLTDYHDDDLSGRTWIFPAGTVLSLGVESEVANYSEATQRLEVSFVFDFSDVELQWTNGSQSGVVKYQDASFAITDVATATQLLSETEGDIQVRVDDRDYRFLWTEVHSETQASEDAQFSQSLGVDIEGASFEFGPYSITDIDAAPTIYIQIDKVRYGPFTADEVESWLNDDEAAG